MDFTHLGAFKDPIFLFKSAMMLSSVLTSASHWATSAGVGSWPIRDSEASGSKLTNSPWLTTSLTNRELVSRLLHLLLPESYRIPVRNTLKQFFSLTKDFYFSPWFYKLANSTQSKRFLHVICFESKVCQEADIKLFSYCSKRKRRKPKTSWRPTSCMANICRSHHLLFSQRFWNKRPYSEDMYFNRMHLILLAKWKSKTYRIKWRFNTWQF